MPNTKNQEYFNLVVQQFLDLQAGTITKISINPKSVAEVKIFARAMLRAAEITAGAQAGDEYNALYGWVGGDGKVWGTSDNAYSPALDKSKNGTLTDTDFWGNNEDSHTNGWNSGYLSKGLARAVVVDRVLTKFQKNEKATPADLTYDPATIEANIKKNNESYETYKDSKNPAAGKNTWHYYRYEDDDGVNKGVAKRISNTRGNTKDPLPALPDNFVATVTTPAAPATAPAKPAATTPTEITFTKTEFATDIALRELFGELPGSNRIIFDHNKVGLDKLKNAVSSVVQSKKAAFENTPADKLGSARKEIYVELYKNYVEAGANNNNGWAAAIAVMYRADTIAGMQENGITSVKGFANASEGQVHIKAALAYAKGFYDAAQLAKTTPATGPVTPVVPTPVDDDNKEPAKVNRKIWPGAREVTAPLGLDEPLNDDALVTYVSGKSQLGVTYLWRGAHGVDGEEASKKYGDLIQDLQRSLDRVNGNETGGDDGVYGAGTERAVRAIQAKYGLSRDGVAGRQTVTALQVAELAKVLEGKDAAAIGMEAADVDNLLVKGKGLPAKVKAEIEALVTKIETDIVPSADSELAKTVASIKEKIGLTK